MRDKGAFSPTTIENIGAVLADADTVDAVIIDHRIGEVGEGVAFAIDGNGRIPVKVSSSFDLYLKIAGTTIPIEGNTFIGNIGYIKALGCTTSGN